MSSLPISYDIQFTLSKASAAAARDMTLIGHLTPNVDFLQGERIKYFSTWDSFTKRMTAGTGPYWAGSAFFNKSNRPQRIAICAVYENNLAAYNLAAVAKLDALAAITDGSFVITVDGTAQTMSALNFTTATSIDNVVTILNTAASNAFVASNYHGQLLIKSPTTGANSSISYATAATSGTDVSSLLGLSQSSGASIADGYVSGTLVEEAAKVKEFAGLTNTNIFGWTIDGQYRDTQDQKDFADWVSGFSFRAVCALVTNNPTAYSATDTANILSYVGAGGSENIAILFQDNAQLYPDVAYLAEALAVNYSLADQVIDMKFKDIGIAASTLPDPESNWKVLSSKRGNVILYIGDTGKKAVRNGDQVDSKWRTDSWVNICNFIAELEIEVLNVFLRNKKIAYTPKGQNKLVGAVSKIGSKYVTNGSFADREELDDSSENGLSLVKAVNIIPQPIYQTTAAQRAAGIGTPIQVNVNDSGSMRTIALNISVVE